MSRKFLFILPLCILILFGTIKVYSQSQETSPDSLSFQAYMPFVGSSSNGNKVDSNTESTVEAAMLSTLTPTKNYWPLPLPTRTSDWVNMPPSSTSGSGQNWWKFTWNDGNGDYWALDTNDNPPEGSAAITPCPGGATALISAAYFGDGAWGDTAGNSSNDRLSINFHKSHECSYFNPGTKRALRWYTQGWQQFSSAETGTYKYLTFPEYTSWSTTTQNTMRWGKDSSQTAQASMWGYNSNSSLEWSHKTRWEGQTNPHLNVYLAVPDDYIDKDITVGVSPNLIKYCAMRNPAWSNYPWFISWSTNWNQIRSDSRIPNDVCSTTAPSVGWTNGRWKVLIRKTVATWPGATGNLLYVGYWESADYNAGTNTIGVCEEYWFAQNVGPVYIASYSASRETTCIQNLAVSNTIAPFGSLAIDYPDLYLPSANTRGVTQLPGYTIRPALGYLKLDDRCIQSPATAATNASCWVDYN